MLYRRGHVRVTLRTRRHQRKSPLRLSIRASAGSKRLRQPRQFGQGQMIAVGEQRFAVANEIAGRRHRTRLCRAARGARRAAPRNARRPTRYCRTKAALGVFSGYVTGLAKARWRLRYEATSKPGIAMGPMRTTWRPVASMSAMRSSRPATSTGSARSSPPFALGVDEAGLRKLPRQPMTTVVARGSRKMASRLRRASCKQGRSIFTETVGRQAFIGTSSKVLPLLAGDALDKGGVHLSVRIPEQHHGRVVGIACGQVEGTGSRAAESDDSWRADSGSWCRWQR